MAEFAGAVVRGFHPVSDVSIRNRIHNPLAVRLYGLSLIATNVSGLFFWLYATAHRELIVPIVTKEFARTVVMIHSSPMLGYGLGVALAGWSTKTSLVLYAAVPLFFILPNPLLERRIGTAAQSPIEEGANSDA